MSNENGIEVKVGQVWRDIVQPRKRWMVRSIGSGIAIEEVFHKTDWLICKGNRTQWVRRHEFTIID